jgi:putative acetyltransferase
MLVRRELPTDAAAVHAVHTAAFGRGRSGEIAEAVLWDQLRNAGDVVPELSFVATIDSDVVGHAGCSWADVDDTRVVALGPLGVHPEQHRRGIGTALVHAVLGGADARNEPMLVLLGDPAYYSRFGFEPAGPLGIAPPDSGWATHFQVRRLAAWADTPRGRFRYAPAFGIAL